MTDLAGPPQIVLAAPGEHALLGDILGDAFSHDPVMNWGMPKPDSYSRFFRMEAEQLFIPHQLVHRDSANRGAAMWLPPGVAYDIKMSVSQLWLIFRLIMTTGIHVIKRLETLQTVMSKHHPKQPHYYLHAIGARQAHQGQGIGSSLLKHVTCRCDREHMPAYLESSSEKNNPLYERHGFEVTGEYKLAPAGPTFWFMWREPRPLDY